MGFMAQASSPTRIMWKRCEGSNCTGYHDVGRGGRESRHREAYGAQGVMETEVRARIQDILLSEYSGVQRRITSGSRQQKHILRDAVHNKRNRRPANME